MNLEELLQGRTVVEWSPRKKREINRLLRDGQLVRVLPGRYLPAERARHPGALAEAVVSWDPTAVFTGATAAAISLEDRAWPTVLTYRSTLHHRYQHPLLQRTRGPVAPEFIVADPLPHLCLSMALLEVARHEGAKVLHTALRQHQTTPAQLSAAAEQMRRWPGGNERLALAESVAANPWSEPESTFHDHLMAAGFRDWQSNMPVTARSNRYFLDIAFPAEQVAIEVDSPEYHADLKSFERDRQRHNDLTSEGWTILHVTPAMLDTDPGAVLTTIRKTLAVWGRRTSSITL